MCAAPASQNAGPPRILRFRASERWLHWCIAIPFLACLLSAAVLMLYYNPNPQRPHREIVSSIHRWSGVALMVLPVLVLLLNLGDIRVYLRNLKEGKPSVNAHFS